MNYEAELNRLKEAQKKQAISELENVKNTSLSDLNAEAMKIKPAYAEKRNTANVQNQVHARNFHEYLANSGRSNSGIGAQYEMGRQNVLQRNLNQLNVEEQGALNDVERRRGLINQNYNNGLAGANAKIEANYIQNLIAERDKAWQRQQQEKQFNESVRQFNLQLANSRRSTGGGSRGGYYKSRKPNAVETDWWSGVLNSDTKYGTFSTKDKYGRAYQPNNLGKDSKGNVKYLKSSGKTVSQMFGGNSYGSTGALLNDQTVWKYGGNYYVWDGSQNQYIQIKK